MPRKRYPLSPLDPYHYSARSNNREWFYIPIEDTWKIMCRYLYYMNLVFDVKLHSFVLMSNHWHLIASFPLCNHYAAMNYFMRETSKMIGREVGRTNHIYGGPAYPTRLSSYQYFVNSYKYVYRNPVEAQICEKVEEYKYSTLRGLLGGERVLFPIAEDTLLFESNISEALKWLNESPEPENYKAMRLALTHGEFQLAQDARTRKPHKLETSRY